MYKKIKTTVLLFAAFFALMLTPNIASADGGEFTDTEHPLYWTGTAYEFPAIVTATHSNYSGFHVDALWQTYGVVFFWFTDPNGNIDYSGYYLAFYDPAPHLDGNGQPQSNPTEQELGYAIVLASFSDVDPAVAYPAP